ncbi:ABC transporter permease [Bacillaceae bacterium SIJ1]|uniref:ABC transporter permease n=1 Tax=Litoribacterium kuwaitense TaxID=1398745 RepID=UPI0013EDD3F9|nr:ABC transporter permease [Litoribacterium kuwaitense]NGP44597.1 ABC transporter permease [Litoribacterium kuwaitense]
MRTRYLLIALVVLSVVSLFVGVSSISPTELFSMSDQQAEIFWSIRVPRLLSILLAGAGVSICGLIMQQLSRNKFVSPTTAGTMDFARLGILVSLLLFTTASPLVKMGIAFLFALGGTLLFMKLLDRIQYKDAIFIPLIGLMFGNIVSAISTFFAYKYDLIQNLSAMLQGNFSLIMSGRYELLFISIPCLLAAWWFADRFTLAGMGEDFATNLGLKYRQVLFLGLTLVALVISTVILTIGTIPFLGLIIPNIVSIYSGDHLRKSLWQTAILGAAFVLLSDIVSRVIIFPYEISISLTVGVIGSVIFIILLLRRRAYGLAS